MAKSRTISIYLLKEGVSFQDALLSDDELAGRTPLEDCGSAGLPVGYRLYLADYNPRPPWWKDYIGITKNITQQAKGAILFLEAGGRNFAITFGLVAHYLKDWKYEYDFGLLVTLNSVNPVSLKSADILNPENARRERIQPAKGTGLDKFGVNFDENIVRKLSGRTEESLSEVYSQITGSDSVRITTKVELSELKDLCGVLLAQYRSDSYKTFFPNLRNIVPIKDPSVIDRLDSKLLSALKEKDESVILSIPEIVDYSNISGVKFSNGHKYELLLIDSLWNAYEGKFDSATINSLKNWHLRLVDQDDNSGLAFAIYKCLVWDCELDDKTYHFSEGLWYGVNVNFSSRLIDFLDQYFVESNLPVNSFKKESDYNKAVADTDENFLCLDRTNIAPPHATPIEPCDLIRLSTDGKAELIHVKVGVCSSVLSHLFFQGHNSAQVLAKEKSSRDRLVELVEDATGNAQFKDCCKAVQDFKIRVVYAIITKKAPDLKARALPFFSRISLKALIERLESMQVDVQVMLIKDNVACA